MESLRREEGLIGHFQLAKRLIGHYQLEKGLIGHYYEIHSSICEILYK